MSEKNTSNQQDTTKQNEKYDVVYNKNSGYSQSEVTKLIKIYHMAMAAGDNVTVQDAYTKIYFFIAKYVYKTLWGNYHTLMQNKYHREDIVQDVWVKIFNELKNFDPDKGASLLLLLPVDKARCVRLRKQKLQENFSLLCECYDEDKWSSELL